MHDAETTKSYKVSLSLILVLGEGGKRPQPYMLPTAAPFHF